ncbi:MAG: hypothetical protein MUD02_02430, partial [Bacteroidales bacterium]|nr:hypothetical protein [Bacteroidales bacterium]
MKEPVILKKLKPGAGLAETGNKAASLLFLQRNRFRIPVTYILAASCQDRYLETGAEFMTILRKELSVLPGRSYAVRSSTTLEDSSDYTFAGQFQTVTNVSGTENLVKAILEVWKSSRTGTESEYMRRTSVEASRCAVIIQEMVDSKLAGVAFSKNPVTGRPETIIEAVEGQGEELVQKGAIASRWRFAGQTLLDGNSASPHYELIRRIAADTVKIKSLFKRHADIEWAFDGTELYYLQVRPVTGQAKMNVYSNKMAKEMLPGQVKPLVWSVNIPVVNGTWISILERIVGHISLRPEDLARQFYFRTYFNVAALSAIFREFGMSSDSLEELLFSRDNNRHSFKPGLRILKHSFRITRFALGIFRFESFFREEFRRLDARYRELELRIAGGFEPDTYQGLCKEL